jgi:hypothetical protein
LPRIDSQKVPIKQEEISSSTREQQINQGEMKHEDSSDNVIRVRTQERRLEEEASSSDSHQRKQEELPKSVIFGHNDLTEKSENSDNVHERGVEVMAENEGESEGESSVELSQLFTRNKSLKFIIGKNEFYRPHRTTREQTRDCKSKSMFARP